MIDAVAGALVPTHQTKMADDVASSAIFVKQRVLDADTVRLARIYINMCGFCRFIHRSLSRGGRAAGGEGRGGGEGKDWSYAT